MILIDSSLWLEYFKGSSYGKLIKENKYFQSNDFIVPSIVVFEVHKKLLLELNKDIATEYSLSLLNGLVVELDFSTAIMASNLSIEKKLPMADSIIYTTALLNNAALLTMDKHFKDLDNVEYYEKK